jgi:hypothetical protein
MQNIKMKSQAALEFLTTYAWIIISVLAIVGVLAYYGYFNPKSLQSDECDFGTQIICEDFGIETGVSPDVLHIQLRSTFPESINLTITTKDPGVFNPEICGPVRLNPGTETLIDCTGEYSEYDKQPLRLIVTFIRSDGSTSHNISAKIIGGLI